MSGRFVRASKYRHVFGRSTKKEQCYDNLRISKNAWDTNLIKANPEYISVNWESSGGGAFAVIPINERGRLPELIPLFRGHTGPVLDTDWNPFNDSVIASGSDDGKVGIWRVPDNFTLYSDAEEPVDVTPQVKLTGHSRKVGHVLFNPAAENVLASSSGDYTVKMWDVEAGAPKLTLKHSDIVQSMSWSANGSLLVTTARDKKLRIWDVRQEKPVHEGQGHHGAKNSRAVWMGEHDRIATTGFSKMSDRQLGLWDVRAPREPINGFDILDSISGVCMPFWDEGTQCLYLAGKGDGNIRYYEYENDKFEYLTEYKSGDPQRGVAFMPKRGVNVHENEVVRCFKTVNDQYIEPISFIVPRRAEVFQDDIYPPTVGIKPAMSAPEWFSGKEAIPPKISLEQVYEGTEPVEVVGTEDKRSAVPGDAQPPKPSEPEAAKSTPAPKPTPAPVAVEPTPASFTRPSGSIKDNKDSMSAMASKFADRDDDAKDDDEAGSSSFDEVPKPVERPSASLVARMEEKTKGPEISKAPDTTAVNASAAKAAESTTKPSAASSSSAAAPASTQPESRKGSVSASGAAEGIKGHLSDIKAMLESQSEQIAQLTGKVNELEKRLPENQDGNAGENDKDKRIRELERQLEEARL